MATQPRHVDEIKAELNEVRAKKESEGSSREKKDWHGLVYCDSNGYCSISGKDLEGVWLGRTDEIIPYLKSRGISGDNVDSVLLAVEEFRAEKKEGILHKDFGGPTVSKTQSCHLATKKLQRHISIPPPQANRATFLRNSLKNDTKLLKLLESLVNRDIGIPTIHRELNEQGYAIPYRTVGRWVGQMRSRELL